MIAEVVETVIDLTVIGVFVGMLLIAAAIIGG